jgi:hypothetical protein
VLSRVVSVSAGELAQQRATPCGQEIPPNDYWRRASKTLVEEING